MERLLSDAQKLSGVEYDISSYADIVDAIHVVQTEMGITGTTAKEAATTIQGSVSAMKSAWKNLIVGIADDNQDFDKLVSNFVDSAVTAGNNLIPRIETSIKGVAKLVSSASQNIIPLAVDTIVNALPDVVSAGASLIGSLANGIVRNLPALADAALEIVFQFSDSIIDGIPNLISTIVEVVEKITGKLFSVDTLTKISDTGLKFVTALSEGLISAIPELLRQAPILIGNYVSALIVQLPKIIATGTEIIFALVNGILDSIPNLVAAIPTITMAIVNGILTNLDDIILAAIQITLSIAMGMIEAIPNMITQLPRIFLAIVNAFKEFNWKDIGSSLLTGIWNGINDKVEWLKGKVRGVVDKIKGWFTGKDGFDEHSPSKWSKKVFQYVMDGGVNGIDAGMPGMMSAVNGAVNSIKSGFDVGTISARASASGSAQNNIRAAIHDEISKIGIYLDGNTLVGGISDRMNQGLGSIYAGNERRAMA